MRQFHADSPDVPSESGLDVQHSEQTCPYPIEPLCAF
jgi:hypothetical protein